MICEACRSNCQIRRKLKSHIGSESYCKFCENKDFVVGKLNKYKRELLEEKCLLMLNLSQNEEYIGTFKKHVETLHCILI
jgi:hypothetical protein